MNYEYNGQPLWYQGHIIDLLPYAASLCVRYHIPFWLDWGTLLGARRNRRMIPWDFDIDLGIFHDDAEKLLSLSPQVEADGYGPLTPEYTPGNNRYIRKIRLYHPDQGIDFHVDFDTWVFEDGVYKWTFDLSAEKIHTPVELAQLDRIEFEGNVYPCPKEPDKSLARLIGPDWRIPKISNGNKIFIKQYDNDNQDIWNEVNRHGNCD